MNAQTWNCCLRHGDYYNGNKMPFSSKEEPDVNFKSSGDHVSTEFHRHQGNTN